ncbi:fructose-2,6-bisphosphatase [Anopheles sinensis]|uniref:Fructose-2,6-bisphosphatase n=1 Tax=Anopheles sinensis TaxID=74873 RepID=A0A084VXQ0_ANOSI|nr:fructose-2,6-bisphosphatase [Anopheles sinensis]
MNLAALFHLPGTTLLSLSLTASIRSMAAMNRNTAADKLRGRTDSMRMRWFGVFCGGWSDLCRTNAGFAVIYEALCGFEGIVDDYVTRDAGRALADFREGPVRKDNWFSLNGGLLTVRLIDSMGSSSALLGAGCLGVSMSLNSLS